MSIKTNRVSISRVVESETPCEGQGCPNSAQWRIGVPASVLYLCERCVAEVQTRMENVRKGRK